MLLTAEQSPSVCQSKLVLHVTRSRKRCSTDLSALDFIRRRCVGYKTNASRHAPLHQHVLHTTLPPSRHACTEPIERTFSQQYTQFSQNGSIARFFRSSGAWNVAPEPHSFSEEPGSFKGKEEREALPIASPDVQKSGTTAILSHCCDC